MNRWTHRVGIALIVATQASRELPAREQPHSAETRNEQAVEMLLSENVTIRKDAYALILNERKTLIHGLEKLILDKENFVKRAASVKAAITILGKLRAVEAVDVLVTVIDYPLSAHPDAKTAEELAFDLRPMAPGVRFGGYGRSTWKPVDELCPAVRALINIGEPCLDQVIERVASSHGDVVTSAEAAVLRGLQERAPVRERLKRAIAHARPPERDRLKRALEALDIDPVKYRQERLRRYAQEIWEKSQKQKQKR